MIIDSSTLLSPERKAKAALFVQRFRSRMMGGMGHMRMIEMRRMQGGPGPGPGGCASLRPDRLRARRGCRRTRTGSRRRPSAQGATKPN